MIRRPGPLRYQIPWYLISCLAAGCARSASVSVTMPLMPPIPRVRVSGFPSPTSPILLAEPFDTLDYGRWRDVGVEGYTTYEAATLDGRACLKAHSQGTASILLTETRFDPDTYEWLAWDWRVDRLVEGEDLNAKAGSDAAARVYVYFDTIGLPWQKHSLDYVWSATLPVGTVLSSTYADNAKMFVVESGTEHLGTWQHVERNIRDDYMQAFGTTRIPRAVAVGLMTDTDNTKTESLAYFDSVIVSRKPGAVLPETFKK